MPAGDGQRRRKSSGVLGRRPHNNPFPGQQPPRVVQHLAPLIAAVGLTLLALPAAGYAESEAPALRPDVLAAGHAPEIVAPHTQWSGTLSFRPGSNVTAASYQICRVGMACFAPPAVAQRDGDTFRFHTSNYTVAGKPVDYQAGWRVGVKWILTEGEPDGAPGGTRVMAFPSGLSPDDPACAGEAQAMECQESHYVAFNVAGDARGTPGAPGAGPLAGFVALVVAAAWRSRSRHG